MTLRAVLIALVALALIAVLALCWVDPGYAGMAVMLAILLAALLFERSRYQGLPLVDGADWQATGERFVDDDSGQMMEVWFNPVTGQRDYRAVWER